MKADLPSCPSDNPEPPPFLDGLKNVVFRSRVVLMASTGMTNRRTATELGTNRPTVILWRQRFLESGPTALVEHVRDRGRKPQITAQNIKQVVEATLQTKP